MVREAPVPKEDIQLREKLARTALSVAIVVLAVFAVRWTVRAMMSRAYRASYDVSAPEMPVVQTPRIYSLAALVPAELHVNLAGLAVRRRAERLGMPYELAVDVAEEKAASAGWERLDEENALTIKNLSGMERVYKTPEGSIVLREVRAIMGDDSLMEDFLIPAEMIPAPDEQTTPDVLARRSAAQVKELMPPVVRDVVIGSPLFTELVERGGGAALIVHCVVETSAAAATRSIEASARKSGWAKALNPLAGVKGAPATAESWTKGNLTFYFEVVPRPAGGGCDVDYRFTDDEVFISKKGNNDEN